LKFLPFGNFVQTAALSPEIKFGVKIMGFGRGILLWLLGVPLPIIILLALFWR
jgi:hypothetical protein